MGRILEEVEDHLAQHPTHRSLLRPFLPCFDVTWGRQKRVLGSSLGFFFLKPNERMEDSFGFDTEILAVYSEYPTLEPRTMQAIEMFLADFPARGRVDPMTVLIISEDKDPSAWARDYMLRNPESRLVVAFSAKELREVGANEWHVRKILAKELYQRDLFNYRLPLQGDTQFFGRESLLFDLLNAFKNSENRGLFGLRKTGKTSLLFKLQRRIAGSLEDGKTPGWSIYVDCKLPMIRRLRWDELLIKISKSIRTQIGLSGPTVSPQDASEVFFDTISSIPEGRRIMLIFDEIEYIGPFSRLDTHWHRDFIDFWQTIWSCQSDHKNMATIIAGVNPSLIERDLIDGVQNPLFGIVSQEYLRGLGVDEVHRMLRQLGRTMGLRFDSASVEYLHKRYAGHPLLIRISCSLAYRSAKERGQSLPIEIGESDLRSKEQEREAELTFYAQHVVSELQMFYPEEYHLLEYIATGQLVDYLEFASHHEFTSHLQGYGLLSKDNTGIPKITIPVVERYIGIEAQRRVGRKTVLHVIPRSERESWLQRRIEAIEDNSELLRGVITNTNNPPLYSGPFPNASRFARIDVCQKEAEFTSFIATMNCCFVEPVEAYGRTLQKNNYFWDMCKHYPALGDALKRIKVYRHSRVHLTLKEQVEAELQRFLTQDLEGKSPAGVPEIWFILQQCVLDSLLLGLMTEYDRML